MNTWSPPPPPASETWMRYETSLQPRLIASSEPSSDNPDLQDGDDSQTSSTQHPAWPLQITSKKHFFQVILMFFLASPLAPGGVYWHILIIEVDVLQWPLHDDERRFDPNHNVPTTTSGFSAETKTVAMTHHSFSFALHGVNMNPVQKQSSGLVSSVWVLWVSAGSIRKSSALLQYHMYLSSAPVSCTVAGLQEEEVDGLRGATLKDNDPPPLHRCETDWADGGPNINCVSFSGDELLLKRERSGHVITAWRCSDISSSAAIGWTNRFRAEHMMMHRIPSAPSVGATC